MIFSMGFFWKKKRFKHKVKIRGNTKGKMGEIKPIFSRKMNVERRPVESATTSELGVRFDGHTVLEFPNLITDRWVALIKNVFLHCCHGTKVQSTKKKQARTGADSNMEKSRIHFVVFYLPSCFSQDSQEKNSYAFKLKTVASNGLIVWQNKGRSIRGDFLSLAVVEGCVEFAFDLGKEKEEMFRLRSEKLVADGKWHTVTAERSVTSNYSDISIKKPKTCLDSFTYRCMISKLYFSFHRLNVEVFLKSIKRAEIVE